MVGQVLKRGVIQVGVFRFDVSYSRKERSDKERKARLYRRFFGHCAYCGCKVSRYLPPDHPQKATRDHIVPRSTFRNVPDRPDLHTEDTVLACNRCNRLKGSKSVIVFLAQLNRSA